MPSLATAAPSWQGHLEAEGLRSANRERGGSGGRGGQRGARQHRSRARARGEACFPRARSAHARGHALGNITRVDDIDLHARDVAGQHVLEHSSGNRHRLRGRSGTVLHIEARGARGDGAAGRYWAAGIQVSERDAGAKHGDRNAYRQRASGRQKRARAWCASLRAAEPRSARPRCGYRRAPLLPGSWGTPREQAKRVMTEMKVWGPPLRRAPHRVITGSRPGSA